MGVWATRVRDVSWTEEWPAVPLAVVPLLRPAARVLALALGGGHELLNGGLVRGEGGLAEERILLWAQVRGYELPAQTCSTLSAAGDSSLAAVSEMRRPSHRGSLGSRITCDAIHAGVFSGGRPSVHGAAPSPTAPASSRVSRE